MSSEQPMVSVRLQAYQHEKYIAQALDSVLAQKVDFRYEIVVGDDFSKDRTREIAEEYEQKHPGVVRVLKRTKGDAYDLKRQEVGRLYNFINIIENCKGKYVALLDGDDYWCDPYKLQKQVDFMENNPEYVTISNNAFVYDDDDPTGKYTLLRDHLPAETDFDTSRLMKGNPTATLTVLFRNNVLKEIPDIYYKGTGGDRRYMLMLSQYGKGKFINQATGVYRIHSGGVTNAFKGDADKKIQGWKNSMLFADRWNEYLGGGYDEEVLAVKKLKATAIVSRYIQHGKLSEAKPYLKWINTADISNRKIRAIANLLNKFS